MRTGLIGWKYDGWNGGRQWVHNASITSYAKWK